MLQTKYINLQGNNFNLIVISVHASYIHDLRTILQEKILKAPHFFSKNTPVVINVSNINNSTDWFNLYKIISNIGLYIIGVCDCNNNKLKKIIIQSGLPILTKVNKKKTVHYNQYCYTTPLLYKHKKNLIINKTQIIDTPIRSGQKIYAQNRDLIIIANVSSGAEIIADGNVHIYGTMRGRVLAGATGDETSQIFCNNLFPELVSIGGYYWLIDQIPQEFLGKSARFYLKNKTLTIQHIL